MNTFARIKPIAAYEKVRYYSIVLGDDEDSLFEHFIAVQQGEHPKKLNHILAWIRVIGEKYGAQEYLFRSEAFGADASALPPKGKHREPVYIEYGKKSANALRLYTFRINERVVFLFDGALKTAATAQNCPNVSAHFKMANILTAAIQTALEEQDLRWEEDFSDINYDENFTLSL